jgi:hypothetical protein
MEGKRRRMPERTLVHPLVHVKSHFVHFSAPSLHFCLFLPPCASSGFGDQCVSNACVK